MEEDPNWKKKTLAIAIGIGALLGAVAGLILVQRSEQVQSRPKLTAGDGVKVGLGLLGVLRMLTDLINK